MAAPEPLLGTRVSEIAMIGAAASAVQLNHADHRLGTRGDGLLGIANGRVMGTSLEGARQIWDFAQVAQENERGKVPRFNEGFGFLWPCP